MGIGLVLAGGGGKGSYQIGVFRALEEFGILSNISAVSGTSVGALNGALFIQNNLEKAVAAWKSISNDAMLKAKELEVNKDRFVELGSVLGSSGLSSAVGMPAFYMARMTGGMFSREGLVQLMADYLDYDRVTSSRVPCYVTCYSLEKLEAKYFNLQGKSREDITTLLLASSAIPGIYDKVTYEGETFVDGGIPKVGDNIPIKPLYDMGLKSAIVVNLSNDAQLYEDAFPGMKLLQIIPTIPLGQILDGTVDFSKEGTKWRMEAGYKDAIKILEPLYEMGRTQMETVDRLVKYKESTMAFEKENRRHIEDLKAVKNRVDHKLKDWSKKYE